MRWIVETAESAEQRGAHATDTLVAPPLADLEVLHRLALSGNMRRIREQASQLAALDARYGGFAARLQMLAAAYETKAILNLVREQLARAGA